MEPNLPDRPSPRVLGRPTSTTELEILWAEGVEESLDVGGRKEGEGCSAMKDDVISDLVPIGLVRRGYKAIQVARYSKCIVI